jgi:hypothetical protein
MTGQPAAGFVHQEKVAGLHVIDEDHRRTVCVRLFKGESMGKTEIDQADALQHITQ